jgi:hypothetical protein
MKLERRVTAFVQLGKVLKEFSATKSWAGYETGVGEQEFDEFNDLIARAKHHNGWFSTENVRSSIGAIADNLTVDKIGQWILKYPALHNDVAPKKVAVIMAGNIPMVGFHDLLCVLLSGHHIIVKCSSQDDKLLPAVAKFLCDIEPEFRERILFTIGKLENLDAVIATGSDNSARYFDYYFGKYPNIIRKNRTSVAILDGEESESELIALGNDIFSYYGLGCRNVSKIFIPKEYDLNKIFGAIFEHKDVVYNNKYANNYEYTKTLFMMNSHDLLENGFIVFKEDKGLTSPVASLYYEYYEDKALLNSALEELAAEIQCVVSRDQIPFGKAQRPELWDYADDVDTMAFLLEM